jgi:hypothetical protein
MARVKLPAPVEPARPAPVMVEVINGAKRVESKFPGSEANQ